MGIFVLILGVALAVFGILKGLNGAYAMAGAAALMALVLGFSPDEALGFMFNGTQKMTPIIMRILSAGVLVGVMSETRASASIAEAIIKTCGRKYFYIAVIATGFFLTSIGIFVDVVLISIAPIVLTAAKRLETPVLPSLVALTGGLRLGNFASPSPLVIAVAEIYKVQIGKLILFNYISAFFTLMATVLLTYILQKKESCGYFSSEKSKMQQQDELPSFGVAIVGPTLIVLFIIAQPFFNLSIDPYYLMPVAGLLTLTILKKLPSSIECINKGLQQVSGIIMLLLGTGALSGVVINSQIQPLILEVGKNLNLPLPQLTSAISLLLVTATGSATTAGALTAEIFAPSLSSPTVAVMYASLVCAGAVCYEGALHCSYFYISKESLGLSFRQKIKAVPWEALQGYLLLFFTFVLSSVYFSLFS